MKKTNKKTLRTIVSMLIMSVLIVISYYFIRTNDNIDVTKSVDNRTQAEVLIDENINKDYPSTPKEVLELYVKISKNFYERTTTDEQIEKLSEQMLLLFDEELIKNNPSEEYKLQLKNEISRFRDKNISIMNYIVGDNSLAEFWTKEYTEYASHRVSYTLKEGSNYTKVYDSFVFRKSKEGKWKILGWTSADPPSEKNPSSDENAKK